ncbi:MAG: hypothetical protein LBP81_02505 [Treponema sp.]|jgi:hypothetical protein|nr:hypothetical protein [Treponema sp.]
MIRIEIIANHSVEENILEAMQHEGVGKFYTKYPGVYGVGSAGPRMGDAIWPEENFALVIWCGEEEARGIARAVAAVKAHFPDEGIKLFGLPENRPAGVNFAALAAVQTMPPLAESPPSAQEVSEVQAPPDTAQTALAAQTVSAAQTLPGAQTPPRKISAPVEDGPEDPNSE